MACMTFVWLTGDSDLVVSLNRDPKFRPAIDYNPYSGDPQKSTPNFGKFPFLFDKDSSILVGTQTPISD